MDELFEEFLKTHNLLTEYKHNLGLGGFTWDELSHTAPKRWVSNLFTWGKTPEGVHEWMDIDDKWQGTLRLFNQENDYD